MSAALTFEAGELIRKGQLVTLGWRPGTVEIAAPGDFALGVATHPVSEGSQVLVEVFGDVFEGIANGAIGWADRLEMADHGRVSANPEGKGESPFATALGATLNAGEPVKCVRGGVR